MPDYSTVHQSARVAVYDDMLMPPRIIDVKPAPTVDFIENLAVCINEQKTLLGGKIPYSAIREVSENFIHAEFNEIVVSILDGGNTIRFCDQGPGIADKEKAQLPGFTSATEPMKNFIKGVGSGLPLVKEYLDLTHGRLVIEDNLEHGAAITISLVPASPSQASASQTSTPKDAPAQQSPLSTEWPTQNAAAHRPYLPPLTEREGEILGLVENEGPLGVTDIVNLTGYPRSSVHKALERLEDYRLVRKTENKKRAITEEGSLLIRSVFSGG